MPQQIHWIVGNADLRFHVIFPKIYRSWQIGTGILWAIVRVKDLGGAML